MLVPECCHSDLVEPEYPPSCPPIVGILSLGSFFLVRRSLNRRSLQSEDEPFATIERPRLSRMNRI